MLQVGSAQTLFQVVAGGLDRCIFFSNSTGPESGLVIYCPFFSFFFIGFRFVDAQAECLNLAQTENPDRESHHRRRRVPLPGA